MIKSFGSQGTEDLYHGIFSRESKRFPREMINAACRKLDMLNAACELKDLMSPPGNRLEKLKGAWSGKYSIRINQQYRIVFVFERGDASEVEVLDYH